MGAGVVARGLAALAAFSRLCAAAPSGMDGLAPRAATCNTASNRACWTNGFNINTDYEASVPLTGVTRTYTLTLTEVKNWVGPDGRVKEVAMLINNQLPGPTIVADWGDRINITVINNLETNGTSFHWHGIRQLNSNLQDGANGVTECPIPPKGGSKTYSFIAEQHGTSWYHSHYAAQLANGVVGTMQINGPASLPYDTDLGVFPIFDWYYQGADRLIERINDPNNPVIPGAPGAPPPSDNLLFNGTNINPSGTGGSYAKVVVTPGKRHRLRLINMSTENMFTISISNHTMTVIAVDLVPVNSFTTSSLFIGIGQRYDVTIDASQATSNYWINATFSNTFACGSSNNPHPAAILSYTGAPSALPTFIGTAPPESRCEDTVDFSPVVTRTIPTWTPVPTQSVSIDFVADTTQSSVLWRVNSSAIDVSWEKPTLEYILAKNFSFPASENLITVPETNTWMYFLMENTAFVGHPMHLHGHDFMILGRSPAPANPFTAAQATFSLSQLHYSNPTRRDVTMLPARGWLLFAFKVDNPGAWLMHCHIAWHVSQGLSVQFLELASKIPTAMDLTAITPNCDAWRKYSPTDPFPKVGSGLKARQ